MSYRSIYTGQQVDQMLSSISTKLSQADISATTTNVTNLQASVASIQAGNTTTNANITQLQSQVASLQTGTTATNTNVNGLTASVTSLSGDMNTIKNGTATDAGTITGSETTVVSRGSGFLKTTISKIAAFVASVYFNYSNGTYRVPFTGGGQVFAVGRNSDNAGANYQGLQIGGGDTTYGSDGVYLANDGHASWMRMQPTKNESSIEALIYNTGSAGQATGIAGTNTVTWVSGTPFNSSWNGRKFYFNGQLYQVAGVLNANQLTVQVYGGGTVSFASTVTDTFHVVYVSGTGTCNVSGNVVTRVNGDPFIPFFSAPFSMTVNGSPVTVTGFTDTGHLTISQSMTLTNVSYSFSTDINDQIVTLRLEKLAGSDEENLSIFGRYDGYHIRSYFAGNGKSRPIYLGNSSVTNLTLPVAGGVNISGSTNVTGNSANFQDYGSLFMRATSQTNLNGWRLTWGQNGVADGALTIQHSTDNFGSNFLNALVFSTSGTATFGSGVSLGTVGTGLAIKEGTNAKQGVATLVSGTVTVNNTSVTANSRIQLTAQDNNSTGALRVSARTAGTSFVITSSNSADSGVVAYEIFEPA